MTENNIDIRPYVVSGDIEPLLKRWGKSRGFTIPDQRFFREMSGEFSSKMKTIFPTYEYVSAEELYSGLTSMSEEAFKDGLVPISVDPTFQPTLFNIGVSRSIDRSLGDAGLMPRAGFPDLSLQYDQLKASGLKDVALFDDVVFTGGVIMDIREQLEMRGIRVQRVCAAIAVSDGMEKVVSEGLEFSTTKSYPDGVIDEVCERDYYPGVPFSGRSLLNLNEQTNQIEDIGIPYILPFGKPEKWASIPTGETQDFSLFCLEQTIKLYDEIGRLSQRKVLGADLDRKFGLSFGKPQLEMEVTNILTDQMKLVQR